MAFDNTKVALIEYDAGAAIRAQKWNAVESDQDVDDCELADHEALCKVREAFFLDTASYNRRDNVMQLPIDFMRKCAFLRA